MINLNDPKEIGRAARAVILKHCRKLRKSNKPMMCVAGWDEQVYRDTHRQKKVKNKYIFDSYEIADACATELVRTIGGKKLRPYPCERSKHGHHHLTSRQER